MAVDNRVSMIKVILLALYAIGVKVKKLRILHNLNKYVYTLAGSTRPHERRY